MSIRFGPAGLGGVEGAVDTLKEIHKMGLRACEIAFTYSIYIKNKEDALRIGKVAKELDIALSIHAPYFLNLNSGEREKREASKKRILDCCEIGELLGVRVVVFHPGYYLKDRIESYNVIKAGILEIKDKIKERGWKVNIAPETMGKINVFGSIEEIGRLKRETGCGFCLDFAHILAREKKVDYEKIKGLFGEGKWHCHFSGIEYGEKGEKRHKKTGKEEWKELLVNLPKDKEIVIINESPEMIEDSIEGLKIYKEINIA